MNEKPDQVEDVEGHMPFTKRVVEDEPEVEGHMPYRKAVEDDDDTEGHAGHARF